MTDPVRPGACDDDLDGACDGLAPGVVELLRGDAPAGLQKALCNEQWKQWDLKQPPLLGEKAAGNQKRMLAGFSYEHAAAIGNCAEAIPQLESMWIQRLDTDEEDLRRLNALVRRVTGKVVTLQPGDTPMLCAVRCRALDAVKALLNSCGTKWYPNAAGEEPVWAARQPFRISPGEQLPCTAILEVLLQGGGDSGGTSACRWLHQFNRSADGQPMNIRAARIYIEFVQRQLARRKVVRGAGDVNAVTLQPLAEVAVAAAALNMWSTVDAVLSRAYPVEQQGFLLRVLSTDAVPSDAAHPLDEDWTLLAVERALSTGMQLRVDHINTAIARDSLDALQLLLRHEAPRPTLPIGDMGRMESVAVVEELEDGLEVLGVDWGICPIAFLAHEVIVNALCIELADDMLDALLLAGYRPHKYLGMRLCVVVGPNEEESWRTENGVLLDRLGYSNRLPDSLARRLELAQGGWSVDSHKYFPAAFKEAVKAFLLAHNRGRRRWMARGLGGLGGVSLRSAPPSLNALPPVPVQLVVKFASEPRSVWQ